MAFEKRHAFGQHFLTDKRIIEAIVANVFLQAEKTGATHLVEIGPGKGAITNLILEKISKSKIASFTVIEKDFEFVKLWQNEFLFLKEKFPYIQFQAISSDFLECKKSDYLPEGKRTVIVSNLPYSAGTPITLNLCEVGEEVAAMTLMMQKEVTVKMRAEIPSKEVGSLSLWIQNRWNVSKLLFVPPAAFMPPPKVDSEVISFEPKSKAEISDLDQFQSLLDTAFVQPRKMLRVNFSKNEKSKSTLEKSGVDGTLRPAQLTWSDWKKMILFLFFAFLIQLQSATANTGEAYGFGSRSASLAQAVVADPRDAFTVYANPAALAARESRRLTLSYALVYMAPSFQSIDNVVLENTFVSDKLQSGSVDTSYRPTFGQSIAMKWHLYPESRLNPSIGFLMFLPILNVTYLDSGENYLPEYFYYRARTQRPQILAGAAIEAFDGFRVGAGLSIQLSVTGKSTVFLQTDTQKPSNMRFLSSILPKATPYFGVHFEKPKFSFGSTLRLPAISNITIDLAASTKVFGSSGSFEFNFTAGSTYIYEPLILETGTSFFVTDRVKFFAQVDFQRWSAFQMPGLSVSNTNVSSCRDSSSSQCGIQISSSRNPTQDFRDIFIPRVATEWKLDEEKTLRAGYAYRPSPIRGTPTGAGNLLDPDKHIIGLGMGLTYKTFMGMPIETQFDANLSANLLVPMTVKKDAGDEAGSGAGDLKIGAPTYTAAGRVLGGGVSMSLLF